MKALLAFSVILISSYLLSVYCNLMVLFSQLLFYPHLVLSQNSKTYRCKMFTEMKSGTESRKNTVSEDTFNPWMVLVWSNDAGTLITLLFRFWQSTTDQLTWKQSLDIIYTTHHE